MHTPRLRFRQVHLDFHTSPWCEDVGGQFDGDAFAQTLVDAHVNSINIFAKCHHGYSYYPTKVGTPHPHLKTDLLGRQIEALHRRDIRCPVYVSIMWDELASVQHPEWVMVDKQGKMINRSPLGSEWGWATMDVSSGYADYVMAQVEELHQLYAIDGYWFDICFALPNYSPWAMAQMHAAGVNAADDAAVWDHARAKQTRFFDRLTRSIHSFLPQASIFYNGTMHPDMGRVAPYMTHLEVESLPTTGQWGYLHYPLAARQARAYGKDFLGMNGRFHMSWGDFGGLKTGDQFDYECGTILAAGGKISVGDQLHPSGKLDAAVYRMIGRTYARVEALEPWLDGAVPTAEIALLTATPVEFKDPGIGAYSEDLEGAAQMLLEMGYQFDIIDIDSDLEGYEAVFVPDGTPPSTALVAKLNAYKAGGGRIVLSGTALLDAHTHTFSLDGVPARYKYPSPTIPCYIRLDAGLTEGGELADDYDYAFYDTAHVVEATDGSQSYGDLRRALFNRTYEHFMGHQHAPVGERLDAPALVMGDNVLYFAAPLFTGYRRQDYWAYRAIVSAALKQFLPAPMLQRAVPGWIETTLLRQPAAVDHPERQIVHLVGFHPRRTFQPILHVDQSWETANIRLSIAATIPPMRVYLAPENIAIPFTLENGRVIIDLPSIGTHTAVVIE